jgi:hypothetical protein
MCWLPTGCALTARQRPKSACRLATSGACARTIGPRTRINRLDDASGRCSVSKRPDQPNASCLFTPPSKTSSTSNAISHPAARSASSETKRSGRGEPPPPPEPELRLPIFTRPKFSSRDSAVLRPWRAVRGGRWGRLKEQDRRPARFLGKARQPPTPPPARALRARRSKTFTWPSQRAAPR